MPMTLIPAIVHINACNILLFSFHATNLLLSYVARQLSSHNFPKDQSSEPEMAWQV